MLLPETRSVKEGEEKVMIWVGRERLDREFIVVVELAEVEDAMKFERFRGVF